MAKAGREEDLVRRGDVVNALLRLNMIPVITWRNPESGKTTDPEDIRVQLLGTALCVPESNPWRDVKKEMPEENMFELSNLVKVTVELSDGSRETRTSYTKCGQWDDVKARSEKVLAWKPMTKPYSKEKEHDQENDLLYRGDVLYAIDKMEIATSAPDGSPIVHAEHNIRTGAIEAVNSVKPVDEWTPVEKGLPPEKESFFSRFKGTDKWKNTMYSTRSDYVDVTLERLNGTRRVSTSRTKDGRWEVETALIRSRDLSGHWDEELVPSRKSRVIAWKPEDRPWNG